MITARYLVFLVRGFQNPLAFRWPISFFHGASPCQRSNIALTIKWNEICGAMWSFFGKLKVAPGRRKMLMLSASCHSWKF